MQRRRFLMSSGGLLAGAALGLSSPARAKGLTQAEYAANDALGLAERVRKKEVTPSELLEEAIRRTEAVDPKLNAVVIRMYDEARRLASTRLSISTDVRKEVVLAQTNELVRLRDAGTIDDRTYLDLQHEHDRQRVGPGGVEALLHERLVEQQVIGSLLVPAIEPSS